MLAGRTRWWTHGSPDTPLCIYRHWGLLMRDKLPRTHPGIGIVDFGRSSSSKHISQRHLGNSWQNIWCIYLQWRMSHSWWYMANTTSLGYWDKSLSHSYQHNLFPSRRLEEDTLNYQPHIRKIHYLWNQKDMSASKLFCDRIHLGITSCKLNFPRNTQPCNLMPWCISDFLLHQWRDWTLQHKWYSFLLNLRNSHRATNMAYKPDLCQWTCQGIL